MSSTGTRPPSCLHTALARCAPSPVPSAGTTRRLRPGTSSQVQARRAISPVEHRQPLGFVGWIPNLAQYNYLRLGAARRKIRPVRRYVPKTVPPSDVRHPRLSENTGAEAILRGGYACTRTVTTARSLRPPEGAVPDLGVRDLRVRPRQDLRLRPPGPQGGGPGHPPRRDLCAAWSQRRGQDHPDQYNLRHRQPDEGQGPGRWSRHYLGLPGGPVPDRAGPAGAYDRRLRDRMGYLQLQPRAVRKAEGPWLYREGAQRSVPVGQEGQQDPDALGRHEAPGHDRQGPLARAEDPLSRRADCGGRC